MVAIFVLLSFILILVADYFVLKYQGKFHPAFEPTTSEINLSQLEKIDYELPSNYFLSSGHTWIKKDAEGLIDIGIDILAASALGGLSIIKCLEEKSIVNKGDVLFVGTYGSEKVEVLSPVSGKVQKINNKIIGNKILYPYRTWGVKIHPSGDIIEKNKLLSGKAAKEWSKEEFKKLKQFLERNCAPLNLVGETMFDGGALFDNENRLPAKNLIKDFQKEFLSL